MFKTKFIISSIIFIIFLTTTSIVKNKTRVLEKKNYKFKYKYSGKKKRY